MESDSSNYTLCDDTSQVRIAFFSIGTCLSALGCVFNGVLLYIFLGKTQRSYPFQTFLAFLDFMLCALYIHCFGLLSISVEYKIAFLYNFVMDSNVVTLVMSRIVQLSIPYTLIANSAEKLTMILGIDCESQFSLRLRIGVILLLLGTATSLRINGLYLYFIDEDENCDFYHRKWLSSHQEEQAKWIHFENVLTFFHTFVSFVLLCALNIVVVAKLRVQHRKTRRQSTSPAQLFSVYFRNFLGSKSITVLTPVGNTTTQTLETRVLC
ncbi:G_PROTEIN_RECEP_F1_2 domain-containing protein [Caenorhabditis elegans]|uniref:G_PROTEIN_RECEP_F1_2 domain-containing protein n=1 Tax=Caenorhabditis elegans TaxID=6239 RepID=O17322_CAEEL|nr:G_PROTEIN_RECEP_F1_2 domain-containing protein [Caenorhabditis elegans]CCD68408.2 G_PROTEIN_RECEP_F1_2 domain-containing protein [Caenorhabditis elegans]|eukprot:NP_508758.2 Uncharacterized protein CELE_D1079.1 [Caenorhabditis elegans]